MRIEELLNEAILETTDHAGHAMLLLDRFRQSSDPQLAEAYRLVHDLMADLAVIRFCTGLIVVDADAAPLLSAVDAGRVAAAALGALTLPPLQ